MKYSKLENENYEWDNKNIHNSNNKKITTLQDTPLPAHYHKPWKLRNICDPYEENYKTSQKVLKETLINMIIKMFQGGRTQHYKNSSSLHN